MMSRAAIEKFVFEVIQCKGTINRDGWVMFVVFREMLTIVSMVPWIQTCITCILLVSNMETLM